ncbi:hypothetical protein V9T40_014472 [Parthenolecanium corni]|uniref:Uncharacterized protein n=1 Tax=Parthenolecanium corni TaxID=536013 RepID=A0AAN9T4Q5_9HEMI
MNAADISGFCDLNITYNADTKLLERIQEFDYRAIALNWTVNVSDSNITVPSKKKKGVSQNNAKIDIFPEELDLAFRNIIAKNYKHLRVFLRITIIFMNHEQLKLVLSSPQIKRYDIIAVVPVNSAAYEHACINTSIDLISFEIGVSNFKPTGKLHKTLISRSGYFEISYGQGLRSSKNRQELITMTQYFSIYGKSKNAIISSGASQYLDLRNPFDVANLGLLFGLSNDMAKKALSHNCKMLLLIAAGRKYGKTAITVELMDESEEPKRKRPKLDTNDKLTNVTQSISSLSTNESS